MAVTSTKDTLAHSKTIRAGKGGSENMPLGTPATIPTPTLQDIAESLVALELDLKDLVARNYRWHAFPYLPKGGRLGLVITIYHPDYNLGIEQIDEENLVALIEGERASIIATRKDAK